MRWIWMLGIVVSSTAAYLCAEVDRWGLVALNLGVVAFDFWMLWLLWDE